MTEDEKKYKEEQRKRLASLTVGSKDLSGNFITKVFSKADEYVIYEIKTNTLSESLRVQIDTEKENDKTLIDLFNHVRVNFAKLKGLLYKVNDDTSVKTRIAHIVSHALSGKADEANKQFTELIDEINKEYQQQFNHRLRYLITILLATLFLVGFSIYNYNNSLYLDKIEIRNLIFMSSAGAIGCFISVSRRLRKTIFEKDVHWILYIIYGFERVFISIFSSAIVYFAIKSNLIFGFANELDKPIIAYIVFGVASGFSETLLPNLLIKLERENE
jgi:ribosome-associated toxin RatA of RatAB toxin-antitoxin module